MIAADLRDLGWRVSKNTVAALMAEMGLAARPKKPRSGTSRPGKGQWKAPDLVKPRRVLGFALGEHHDAELAYGGW